jgi:hypothetical protein
MWEDVSRSYTNTVLLTVRDLHIRILVSEVGLGMSHYQMPRDDCTLNHLYIIYIIEHIIKIYANSCDTVLS